MFGLMLLLVISVTQKNYSPTLGKHGGRVRILNSFISSGRIILYSIVLSSLLCLRLRVRTSYQRMYLQTNSLILKETRFQQAVIGLFGCMSILMNSLANKMYCAMCLQPMHQKLRIMTLHGRISKHATTMSL